MTTGAEAFVIDASVAVKWYLPDEEYREQANLLLARASAGQATLVAPRLLRYEVPAVIVQATRRNRLSPPDARQAIDDFLDTGITLYHGAALVRAAVPLAFQHHLTLYDALYPALARELAVPLLTVDRQLAQLPEGIWLGDYAPTP